MRFSFVFVALFFVLPVIGQTNISGVINQYAQVQDINYCINAVTVDNASLFHVGEEVLLIQMKGGGISTVDNASYGQMNSFDGAGNYEIQNIQSISGNTIFFAFNIERYYNVAGALQLISVPVYTKAIVSAPLTCKKWDGNTGGVLILFADTLTLNDTINVSGKGFLGGAAFNETTCFNNGSGGATTYRCAAGGNCGAPKGEGATNMPFLLGRGANANGGGGGNDHNTGGGGGGNYGRGGRGGQRLNVSVNSCPGPAPGEGGLPFTYLPSENRIFMGGGGGAGDQNNSEGTAGKDGAGIVIIHTKELNANGHRILANGNAVTTLAHADGAGAGGAGGTILLNGININGALITEANGGKGGSLDNGTLNYCFGPGGGGGGGVLLVDNNALLANITFTANGGLSGSQTWNGNAACPLGSVNGAEDGLAGVTVVGFRMYESVTPFVPVTINGISNDTTVCINEPLVLQVQATASHPLAYTWDNGSTGITHSIVASNTKQYVVTVSDNNQCKLTASVEVKVNAIQPFITAVPDSPIILGQTVQLTTITSGYTYQWAPASSLNGASIYNPVAKPERTTTYCVTVTDAINCSGTICRTVEMIIPEIRIPTAFTPNGDGNNDVFRAIEAPKTSVVEIKIYNRWGELIFQSDNNIGWDGKWKGVLQPTESYICRVGYTSVLAPDKVVYKMQSFSLMR